MVHRLSEKEAERLYEKYQTPAHVIAHCREVTRVACGIAEQLNKHGYHLDLDLIRGAGLAHDVARTSEEHWNVGAEILRELGYDDEANIVQQHMSYQFKPVDRLTETDMVCFGDRLVKEHDNDAEIYHHCTESEINAVFGQLMLKLLTKERR